MPYYRCPDGSVFHAEWAIPGREADECDGPIRVPAGQIDPVPVRPSGPLWEAYRKGRLSDFPLTDWYMDPDIKPQ